MKIVLLHYHLKRGGVTTVIRHQIEAIKSLGWDPLVLSGEPPKTAFPCEVQIVEGLAYDRYLPPDLTPSGISEAVMTILRRKWPTNQPLLHVHNPTLAKNRHLQTVLENLQHHGMSIVCQIHDFAEDGRPDAYYQTPYLGDCHYVAINPRDHRLLLDAGLQAKGCHLLPNAISMGPASAPTIPDRRGVLYPVRAIRRKNIGEALLLSLFFQKHGPLIITLPPNSRKDHISYRHWKAFALQHDIPVQFDAGLQFDLADLMAQCRFVITTSITEGFGFTFLEAWTAGRALWGRLLPDICQGFIDHGLRLEGLYNQLWVPLAWFGKERLKSRWTAALVDARRRFGLPVSEEIVDAAWQTVSHNDCIDFGLLDEPFQTEAIKRVMDASADRNRIMTLNPILKCPGPPDDSEAVVESNAQAIEDQYRVHAYAGRLKDLYRRAASTPVHHRPDKGSLARAFLSANQFSLLKWGHSNG